MLFDIGLAATVLLQSCAAGFTFLFYFFSNSLTRKAEEEKKNSKRKAKKNIYKQIFISWGMCVINLS